eukprot:SAG31_NODE_10198_length_1172_cov_1.049394_1_plen_128_part_10
MLTGMQQVAFKTDVTGVRTSLVKDDKQQVNKKSNNRKEHNGGEMGQKHVHGINAVRDSANKSADDGCNHDHSLDAGSSIDCLHLHSNNQSVNISDAGDGSRNWQSHIKNSVDDAVNHTASGFEVHLRQ